MPPPSVTGDFKELRHLQAKMLRMGAAFISNVSKQLAQEARKQVVDGFEAQRDPYGERWVPSQRALRESGQTLRDRGVLLNSFIVRPLSDGYKFTSSAPYAAIHNYGGEIKRKGGVLALHHKGGFAKRNNRRRNSSRVAFYGAHEIGIIKRQFIPDEKRGLGPIWTPAFQAVITEAMSRHMGRRAA